MNDKKINASLKIAENKFLAGLNCAESSLLGVSMAIDLRNNLIPRIASGFGGGVNSHGSICGALSGTIMAIGALRGRDELNTPEEKEKFSQLVSKLIEAFKAEFGFINCLDLTGCDFQTKEGKEKFEHNKIRQEKCTEFVKFAVRKGIEILNSND